MAATERAATARPVRGLWCAFMVLAVWLAAAEGHAQQRVSMSTAYYADSDQLEVVHPSVAGSFTIEEDTRVDLGYDADVVSAATIDVRTSASVRPFLETRHGGSAALTQQVARTLSLGGGYALSHTPDFTSHSVGLSGALEDDARVHRFSLALRGAHNTIGRIGDPRPSGELLSLGITAGWSYVATPWLVVDANGALEWGRGFMESPYRFVAVYGAGLERVFVQESVPDERVRVAGSLRVRVALTRELFARASYRLHADDWGVFGHTFELRASVELVQGLVLTWGGRALAQAGASFYRGRYEGRQSVPVYLTRDRELAPGHSLSTDLVARVPLFEVHGVRVHASLRGELTYYRYLDTPLLPDRTALCGAMSLIGEL